MKNEAENPFNHEPLRGSSTPLVSVVTIVRNDAPGLEKTIKSVLNQTYLSIDYIIVDGASTDDTLSVIHQFQDQVAQWVSEPDGGIFDAMNKGARMATGEWLIFMNAGDCFYDSRVLSELQPLLESNADVILGAVEEVLTDELETRHYRRSPGKVENTWKHLPTSHQSILIRTRLQQEHPFDTTFEWCADQNCFADLFAKGKSFETTDRIISLYDCAGGRARDPMLFIRERWRLSQGKAPFLQRFFFFGRECLHCRVYGPFVHSLKNILPTRFILKLRRLRGTAGISSHPSSPDEV